MAYKLKYHPDVKSFDLPKIDAKHRGIIKRAIEDRLAQRMNEAVSIHLGL